METDLKIRTTYHSKLKKEVQKTRGYTFFFEKNIVGDEVMLKMFHTSRITTNVFQKVRNELSMLLYEV